MKILEFINIVINIFLVIKHIIMAILKIINYITIDNYLNFNMLDCISIKIIMVINILVI